MPKINWAVVSQNSGHFYFDLRAAVLSDGKVHTYPVAGSDLFASGNNMFSCREGLIGAVRNFLSQYHGWRGIEVFNEKVRKPEQTQLIMATPGSKPVSSMTLEEVGSLIHTMDCLVGLPMLLLNPTRFSGDWWKTTAGDLIVASFSLKENKEAQKEKHHAFIYNGVDSSILYHPTLISFAFGFMRQAIRLHICGQVGELPTIISRAELTRILTECDVEAGLKVVEQLRPWLEADSNSTYPIRGVVASNGEWVASGDWSTFLNLHKALYKSGFKEVYGTLGKGWSLGEPYLGYNGVHTYFSAANRAHVAKLS